MADKNYVGIGWVKTFNNGGSIINLSLNLSKLNDLETDSYDNIKLTVCERRSKDEKSKATHYVIETQKKDNSDF